MWITKVHQHKGNHVRVIIAGPPCSRSPGLRCHRRHRRRRYHLGDVDARGSTDAVHWAGRLDVVRISAGHLKTLESATEIPPEDVLSRRYRRITPYLYSPREIVALLLAAFRLSPPLRAATW